MTEQLPAHVGPYDGGGQRLTRQQQLSLTLKTLESLAVECRRVIEAGGRVDLTLEAPARQTREGPYVPTGVIVALLVISPTPEGTE